MAIHDGVEALLSTGGIFYTEYNDETKESHVCGKALDRNKKAIMVIEFNPSDAPVCLNLRLNSTPHTAYDSLGFLLSINGEALNFRFYPASDLAVNSFQVLSHKDLLRGQTQADSQALQLKYTSHGCMVQLSVFRMRRPVASSKTHPINPQHQDVLVKGQMLTRSKKIGQGNQLIVNDDISATTSAVFADGLNQPWLNFQWKCEPKATLERLLIFPREPALPDYNILPDPKFYPSIDLTRPIGQYLTKGLGLDAIDKLAFQYLNGSSLVGREHDEVYALARTCNNGLGVEELPWKKVSLLAIQELNKHVFDTVHNLSLCVLAGVDEEDPDEFANAAMKLALTTDLDGEIDKASGVMISSLAYARARVAKIPHEEVRALCQEQSGYSDVEILLLPHGQFDMWAVMNIIEKRYMKAKIQVLRALAEERLAKLQSQSHTDAVNKDAVTEENLQEPKNMGSDGAAQEKSDGNLKKRQLGEAVDIETGTSKRRELDEITKEG